VLFFSPENVIFPKNLYSHLVSEPFFSPDKKKKQFQMGVGRAQSMISICDGHDQINNEMSKQKKIPRA